MTGGADLEADAFAVRAVDITAYAIGAPHERQRIYWAAERLEHATGVGRLEGWPERQGWQRESALAGAAVQGRMGQSDSIRELQPEGRFGDERGRFSDADTRGMGNAMREGSSIGPTNTGSMGYQDGGCPRHPVERPNDPGFWRDAEDVYCGWDGKVRRAEPRIPWVVDGFPGRAFAFAAYGNAVVVPLAEAVIAAYLDCRP